MLKKCLFITLALFSCLTYGVDPDKIIFLASGEDGKPAPAESVTLKVGAAYGWALYTSSNSPISWKEELILPSKPQVWNDKEATSNQYVTEKTSTPKGKDGLYYISNFWSVAEGDPKGTYIFNIYIDDTLTKTFEIEFK